MKITRKFLEKIIKEEITSILLEQDPMKTKNKILQKIKDEIAAVEKEIEARKSPKATVTGTNPISPVAVYNKLSMYNLKRKLFNLKKELKKKESELAGPGENADQNTAGK